MKYQYTISECSQFLADSTVNPRTNKKITKGGPTYNSLVECCKLNAKALKKSPAKKCKSPKKSPKKCKSPKKKSPKKSPKKCKSPKKKCSKRCKCSTKPHVMDLSEYDNLGLTDREYHSIIEQNLPRIPDSQIIEEPANESPIKNFLPNLPDIVVRTPPKYFNQLNKEHGNTLKNVHKFDPSKADWTLISKTQQDMDFLEKHKNYIKWDLVSKHMILSEKYIDKYRDLLNWDDISRFQDLSEQFILNNKNLVNWENIYKYQQLSEEFILSTMVNTKEWRDKYLDIIFSYQNIKREKLLSKASALEYSTKSTVNY